MISVVTSSAWDANSLMPALLLPQWDMQQPWAPRYPCQGTRWTLETSHDAKGFDKIWLGYCKAKESSVFLIMKISTKECQFLKRFHCSAIRKEDWVLPKQLG